MTGRQTVDKHDLTIARPELRPTLAHDALRRLQSCPMLTDQQDLTAQRAGLAALGVADNRIYVDGLTGTNREGPGLREALAACREGDALVATKLVRLARSLPARYQTHGPWSLRWRCAVRLLPAVLVLVGPLTVLLAVLIATGSGKATI